MMSESNLKDLTVDEAGAAHLRQEVHESVRRCTTADRREHEELAQAADYRRE
ncbi:MAG: hypothetical protein P0119_12325 [Nitrospira sp.]|nr:hypothetical protein [Nitrospira sp.]